jgi:hypothetical protein
MNPLRLRDISLLLFWVGILSSPIPAFAQTAPSALGEGSPPAAAPRDGEHDFDFKIGNWKTHRWIRGRGPRGGGAAGPRLLVNRPCESTGTQSCL